MHVLSLLGLTFSSVDILRLHHIEKGFDHPVYDILSDRVVGSVYNKKVMGNKGREKLEWARGNITFYRQATKIKQ